MLVSRPEGRARVLKELPTAMEIIAGIADVKASVPPSEESLREKIDSLLAILPQPRLLVSSSCGCGRVPHDQAIGLNLAKAAQASL